MTGLKQQGLYKIDFYISHFYCGMFLNSDLWPHREKELSEKLEQFKILLKKLPPENYNNLRCVVLE